MFSISPLSFEYHNGVPNIKTFSIFQHIRTSYEQPTTQWEQEIFFGYKAVGA
jgi:hypothetical protein